MTFPTLQRKMVKALEHLKSNPKTMFRFIEAFKDTTTAIQDIRENREDCRHFDFLLGLLTTTMHVEQ